MMLSFLVFFHNIFGQIKERPRPESWSKIVPGARFMDRFLPMKKGALSSDVWGAKGVKPRYIDNGIEDNIWSYWCGSIQKDDNGPYHLFVCGWLESGKKGHFEWPGSYVFDAVSDSLEGPYTLKKMIGKGHNVEAFRLNDGRYVLYVIDGRYISNSIDGPWEYGKFKFNSRDRKIVEDLSNLSFAKREDGSYLMVNRGGGIWVSKDGISEYCLLTDKSIYPTVEGEFEDPVIWRDHIQYHLIVNDWLGRIAYYLRSMDGINWVVDPGEAYAPGIAYHNDGRVEEWFKYERIKVFQDSLGRAIQANLAVVDVQKEEDFSSDNHSSKHITIPLNPGLLLKILDTKPIDSKTKEIRLKVFAEAGFDPHTDLDLSSLRFGSSNEVNFGRGSKLLRSEKNGKDMLLIFDANGCGITNREFAPKLIGKYNNGGVLFGYARLPYLDYNFSILSARKPIVQREKNKWKSSVFVENFGQYASLISKIRVTYKKNNNIFLVANGKVNVIQPYSGTEIFLNSKGSLQIGEEYDVFIEIITNGNIVSKFDLKVKVENQ